MQASPQPGTRIHGVRGQDSGPPRNRVRKVGTMGLFASTVLHLDRGTGDTTVFFLKLH